ncbi:MAG TPA: pyridoxamine 5'-phosphate oxidase family protein [Chitinivibrionales bacterium]|nr:pyridoxamine 5'-phosphate oxidase family protein [Chitinivibrionales bacterium]
MSDLSSDAAAYIEKSMIALLVTVGEENKPFVRFVGPLVNTGLNVYFTTALDSRKVRHIAANPNVTLNFQNPVISQEEFKSVALSGKASQVPEGKEFDEVLKMLAKKSPGFGKYIKDRGFKNWAIYKVEGKTLQVTDLAKSKKTITEEII